MTGARTYICIDLKSYYASVECVERGLDPLTTNLVVADAARTEKTICLAVSPALKAYGIPGRARLFEVIERVDEINAQRRKQAPGGCFVGSSTDDLRLRQDATMALAYIVATPRMSHYMEFSTRIYGIYMKYLAPEDIYVYSVDEVFLDVTAYLSSYHMTARELCSMMIADVYKSTGITATAGIGSNLYLSKVAMDIVAKHMPPDENGVRMAELDERTYRQQLWGHRPITDFWRVGPGYRRKLEENGLYTMGDVARCSLGRESDFYNEELLYRLFGINAQLLIDHAWGWEPCTLEQIRQYRPESNSLGAGQVLQRPYEYEETRVIVQEMAESLSLDLFIKGLTTDQIVLTIGYDIENLQDPWRKAVYKGPITWDYYGRPVPKHAHGTANLGDSCSSVKQIQEAALNLADRILNPKLLVRRLTITANHIRAEKETRESVPGQLDLFTAPEKLLLQEQARNLRQRERRRQKAILGIKQKYGKNAILTGTNFRDGATMIERNRQIGGHRA